MSKLAVENAGVRFVADGVNRPGKVIGVMLPLCVLDLIVTPLRRR